MTCEFSRDDGAYVLGALSPADRLEFKRHLAGCEECTTAVAELAGLPGLLGRVDAAVLEPSALDEPPTTLLPALVQEVRRARRRRLLGTAGLAAAAAVVVAVPLGLSQSDDEPPTTPPGAGASSTPAPVVVTQRMQPVGEVPVRATVSLEQVTWGTRLGLSCTYDPGSVDDELPARADYVLFVRTRTGQVERVGSWRSAGGREMQISAATALTPPDLASVEVRTPGGRVVLRLAT